jgi:hypothetical protein
MNHLEGDPSIQEALSGDAWLIGYCHAGEQRGAYLLLWPAGYGLCDLAFNPKVPFRGANDEDFHLVSRDDVPAAIELERARIEWAPNAEVAAQIALDFFPGSRAAQAIRRSRGMRTSKKRPQQSHLEGERGSVGIWPYP